MILRKSSGILYMKVYCRESEIEYGSPKIIYLEDPKTEDTWYQDGDKIETYFDSEYVAFPMKWFPYNTTLTITGWYNGENYNTFTTSYNKVKSRWKAIDKITTYKESIPINITYHEIDKHGV